MEEELDRQLDEKAAKENLTATHVKVFLKNVITNEGVVAMLKNSLNNSNEGPIFEPKLTRAKAKELAITQPNIPWPMTPSKKTVSSAVQALIEEDLPEDSSDEEYLPDHEDHSDDESRRTSDFDSQPTTPVVNDETLPSVDPPTPENINYSTDGIFKIPGIPHVPTEEESIGHRTRSKLSLSETPLEQIEQAFIPPDITTDMYEYDYDGDEEWNTFLNSLTKTLPHDPAVEDDPEADPEYNVLEDNDLLFKVDKEEMREDKGVKVTRKELNGLVASLVEFEDMYSPKQTTKKKKIDNTNNTTQSVTNNSIDQLPGLAQPELPNFDNSSFRRLLAIHFQQHVQLMTQHFAMTYMHPELHSQSQICKDNLYSIRHLSNGEDSAFQVVNLDDALRLVHDWEKKFRDEKFHANYVDDMKMEVIKGKQSMKKGVKYISEFHPELKKLMMECKALMYPELLPHVPLRCEFTKSRNCIPYFNSEICLLALGLTEFLPLIQSKPRKFHSKKALFMDAATMISQYLMPSRTPGGIYDKIAVFRAAKTDNLVKNYLDAGIEPATTHYISLEDDIKAPKDQSVSSLPKVWQSYLTNKSKSRYESAKKLMLNLSKPTQHLCIDRSLCNPVVNVLPNTRKRKLSEDDSDNTDVNSQVSSSPQLRKTTPRLAKIRSAQNMKLMTQVSGPKSASSSSVSVKLRGKDESSRKSDSSCGSSKGDNEDEIAELMLASTTIKKDTANRKKAKQARESENIKRMLVADNEAGQEERATKFAGSYMQKLHMTLELSNPETLRAVLKLYLEYSEKLEKLKESTANDLPQIDETSENNQDTHDQLAVNLYKNICDTLRDYPGLCSDFLLFLKPHQAAMVGKSVEHTMLQKMSDFINAAQVYFAKQPSRMARLMQAITQLAAEPNVTLEIVHATMDPVLKGHPLIMDMFQQVLPAGKPPESLFSASLFENLTCPVLPHDKQRAYTEESPELYENIELSTPTADDPYGGDNCKCDCHDTSDPNLKTGTEHCISCGVRFLNGRIYLQTSEGLRPAKVTFPGDNDEKFENIARVSLKITEKSSSTSTSTGRRRKSSKNDVNTDEITGKLCTAKISPTKDSDESDRGTSKSKRGGKSPPKSIDQRRLSKSSDAGGSSIASSVQSPTTEVISPLKSKREKRAERREAKAESKNLNTDSMEQKLFGSLSPILSDPEESRLNTRIDSNDEVSRRHESSDSEQNLSIEVTESTECPIDTEFNVESIATDTTWSREQDALLLQNIQQDYSDDTFVMISETLGRPVEQVKARFETLLSLLEKMV